MMLHDAKIIIYLFYTSKIFNARSDKIYTNNCNARYESFCLKISPQFYCYVRRGDTLNSCILSSAAAEICQSVKRSQRAACGITACDITACDITACYNTASYRTACDSTSSDRTACDSTASGITACYRIASLRQHDL